MKKILLSIFVSLPLWSISQSFTLTDPQMSRDGDLLTARISVNNVSSESKDVRVRRFVQFEAPNHVNYFCWGNCYGPATNVSPDVISIAPGGSNTNSFYGDVNTNGFPGVSEIMYCFYNDRNELDSACHVFTFDAATGISKYLANADLMSNVSPNPVLSTATLQYDLSRKTYSEAKLLIRNINGQVVQQQLIQSAKGKLVINTNNLHSGIYMYSLVLDGKEMISRKLNVLN